MILDSENPDYLIQRAEETLRECRHLGDGTEVEPIMKAITILAYAAALRQVSIEEARYTTT